MVVQKKQLLEALKFVMPGVEGGKTVLQGTDTVIFHDGCIFTYNDMISVSVPLEQAGLVSEDISGAVNGDDFFRIINKLPSEEINFTSEENSWVLRSGKSKVEMTLINFDFRSRLAGVKPDENSWIKIDDNFIEGMRVCRIADNKTQLAGVYFNGGYIYVTNIHQVNRYKLKDKTLPIFWLSDKCVEELLKIGKFTDMQLNGSWAHFRCDSGAVFSVKILNAEKYPVDRMNAVLNASVAKENDFHARFPKELFNAIDRAISFSIDLHDRPAVHLELKNDGIEVFAERSSGKYSEKIDWEEEVNVAQPISFYVDANMMLAICSKTLEFYMIGGKMIAGKKRMPKFLFTTPQSIHLMSIFDD